MDSLTITAADGKRLHVGVTGHGPDVLVLSGGPGCVHYLEDDRLAPPGFRWWFPEPRGVGGSEGGPHTMRQAVADLEAVRQTAAVVSWILLGHSWGCDLAVRYALEHPRSVRQLVGVAGHGLHQDRSWSQIYEEFKHTEPDVPIAWDRAVQSAPGILSGVDPRAGVVPPVGRFAGADVIHRCRGGRAAVMAATTTCGTGSQRIVPTDIWCAA